MTNNWKDIHPSFTGMLQEQWEIDNNFTYEQTRDWINIGLLPTDADFCAWLQETGYTALAVLNNADANELRNEYQQSLKTKPLFDWYSEGKINFQQFTSLANKLGTKSANNYNLTQLNNLLNTNTPTKPNYPLTKIMLVIALIGTIIYLTIN